MASIRMYRGSTKLILSTVTRNSRPVSLSSCPLYFTAKRKVTDPDAQAVAPKTSGGGGIAITGTNTGEVEITPADTASLPSKIQYLTYELLLRDTRDRVHTVAAGTLTLLPSVRRTT